jgi:hypothetical protein
MPECEICGEEADKLIKCKSCGTKFCEDCGSFPEKLCEFCAEEELDESSLDDLDTEEFVEFEEKTDDDE